MNSERLKTIRAPLRAAFFEIVNRALATDDGKRAVATALQGLLTRGAVPADSATAVPYADLGRPPIDTPRRTPVFITARFRSGSTLLWNLFRRVPECTSFYEPLNERRWFDSATRGTHVDTTHRGVSDYWTEYDGLAHLGQWYQAHWIDRDLYMDERSWDPKLFTYIDALITAAPQRAVLQFNRVDFRLAWLRRYFPDARLIHLYRHPRDQWCSTLVDSSSVPLSITIPEFEQHDHYYLVPWARDLSYHFPFLDPRTAHHPYDVFYMIWKLSWMFGTAHCHASFSYEALCARPERELPRLLDAANVPSTDLERLKGVISRAPESRWQQYAPQEWFEEREAYCERVLQRMVSQQTAAVPRAMLLSRAVSNH